ncbi:MAG TPA: hypothetical protein VIG41_04960 [Micrococcaceae bacterium]
MIAVDPLGEPGLSIQTAPVETADDAVGWLTLNHQLQTGQGASGLSLIEPPGLQPQRAHFGRWLRAGEPAAWLPPGIHAETVPGTGHAVAIERPDVVSAAVLAH